MSVRLMAMVFDADPEKVSSTQKLVMLSLADHANEDGRSIYPSVKRICDKTALCERVVRRTLGELRDKNGLGLIRITGRSTMNHPNEYAINVGALKRLIIDTPAPDAPPAYSAPGALNAEVGALSAEPPAPRAPKPPITTNEPPSKERAAKPEKPEAHPAILTFREKAKAFPAKGQYSAIEKAVGEMPADLERWGQTVEAWILQGWKPTNVGGMLDFFRKRELPGVNRNAQKGTWPGHTNGSGTGVPSQPKGIDPEQYERDKQLRRDRDAARAAKVPNVQQ